MHENARGSPRTTRVHVLNLAAMLLFCILYFFFAATFLLQQPCVRASIYGTKLQAQQQQINTARMQISATRQPANLPACCHTKNPKFDVPISIGISIFIPRPIPIPISTN